MKLYYPYKGQSTGQYAMRLTIVQSPRRAGVQLAGRLKPIVLTDPEGDALDSVLAAWAAFRARTRIDRNHFHALYRREGCVFV